MTTHANNVLRLTERQKRSVPCPTCHAAAGKPCRGSRIPGANTFGGGWGGPPDLERAHEARRKAALAKTGSPVSTVRVVSSDKGETWTLAPREKTGTGPCPGEAHANAFIDNCMVCAPRWGVIDVFAPPTLDQVTKEGFAVPVNHLRMGGEGDVIFREAEKRGDIRLVFVTEKIGKNGSTCSYGVYVAAPADDSSWPRVCARCDHAHQKPNEAKQSAAGFFCTWCGDNAPALEAKAAAS